MLLQASASFTFSERQLSTEASSLVDPQLCWMSNPHLVQTEETLVDAIAVPHRSSIAQEQ